MLANKLRHIVWSYGKIRWIHSSFVKNKIARDVADEGFDIGPDAKEFKLSTVNPPVLKFSLYLIILYKYVKRLRKYFDPILRDEDYFNVKELVTIEDMFNARVHYGHKVSNAVIYQT